MFGAGFYLLEQGISQEMIVLFISLGFLFIYIVIKEKNKEFLEKEKEEILSRNQKRLYYLKNKDKM